MTNMKKTYIAPEAQMIDLKAATILAGSNTLSTDGNSVDINPSTLPTGNGGQARSMGNFDLWEDIDETNGYKD